MSVSNTGEWHSPNLIERYKSDPKDIQKILRKTEKIILILEKSSNPDFLNLKVQFRVLISKIMIDNQKYVKAIEILSGCFQNIELELKIRLGRFKSDVFM
jgi:hypothetical protein